MGRGGKRAGAGRPKGSGKYGEPTKAMRLPQSLAAEIEPLLANWNKEDSKSRSLVGPRLSPQLGPRPNRTVQPIPLYPHSVAAGLPASVDSNVAETLDLNVVLTKDPQRSFGVRANGDSMIDAGIYDGDLMLVDASIEAGDNDIVIAVVNSELTVKRLRQTADRLWLQPENPDYPPIAITEATELRILGVVTCTIRQFVR